MRNGIFAAIGCLALILPGAAFAQKSHFGMCWSEARVQQRVYLSQISELNGEPQYGGLNQNLFRRFVEEREPPGSVTGWCQYYTTLNAAKAHRTQSLRVWTSRKMTVIPVDWSGTARSVAGTGGIEVAPQSKPYRESVITFAPPVATVKPDERQQREIDKRQADIAADRARQDVLYHQQIARQQNEYRRVAAENASRQAAYKAQIAKQQAEYRAMLAAREVETARVRAEWEARAARCKAGDKKSCGSLAAER